MNWTRRELFIAAAAGGLALVGPAARADLPVRRWRGTALGAGAEIIVVHSDPVMADALIDQARAEVRRLEGIFSLHIADSALARLNAQGRLDAPPLELVELLSLTREIHRTTGGAFDPTVQPLWRLFAEQEAPARPAITDALARVGHQYVRITSRSIAFDKPGMAITLNGVAQGYITDRVAQLFANAGLSSMVSLGEQRALGRSPDNDGWRARVRTPDGVDLGDVDLRNQALAVSAPYALRLGSRGHILDPRRGTTPESARLIAVRADTASRADGYSTALAMLPDGEADAVAREAGLEIVARARSKV